MSFTKETRLIIKAIIRILKFAAGLFESLLKGEPV